jgi:hypothetical protein
MVPKHLLERLSEAGVNLRNAAKGLIEVEGADIGMLTDVELALPSVEEPRVALLLLGKVGMLSYSIRDQGLVLAFFLK